MVVTDAKGSPVGVAIGPAGPPGPPGTPGQKVYYTLWWINVVQGSSYILFNYIQNNYFIIDYTITKNSL